MQETFNVPDVSCGHCQDAIQTSVGGLQGVEIVQVDLDDKVVSVTYDPTASDRTSIVRAIEAAGYAVAG
jgi:copper chaperone